MSSSFPFYVQEPPSLGSNWFSDDTYLVSLLRATMPTPLWEKAQPQLAAWGHRLVHEVAPISVRAVAPHNVPRLVSFDGWGRPLNQIEVSPEWMALHDYIAEEGLLSIGYEQRDEWGEYARLIQLTKCYMFGPFSATTTCPLAMTDGACRLIEFLRAQQASHGIQLSPKVWTELDACWNGFLSADAEALMTSGQFMTERTGGSDLARTETLARHVGPDPEDYELTGYKFFTSATTADVAFTLARIVDAEGAGVQGSRGLSLFLIRVRDDTDDVPRHVSRVTGIKVHKMKDKMGTKALPTAELEFKQKQALLIGPMGKGVKLISWLFNLTRIYTAMGSASAMRYSLALMRDYLHKREVFGAPLADKPLHLATMADMEVVFRGTLQLFAHECVLLGRSECEPSERVDNVLRLLTPVGKLYTAKETVRITSEAVESFGGMGYCEDTHVPALLRDCMVNTIWEGTTNVLSLDVLRALVKHPNALQHFADQVNHLLRDVQAQVPSLTGVARDLVSGMRSVEAVVASTVGNARQAAAEASARAIAYSMARVYIGALLVRHAVATRGEAEHVWTAQRWVQLRPPACSVPDYDSTAAMQAHLARGPQEQARAQPFSRTIAAAPTSAKL